MTIPPTLSFAQFRAVLAELLDVAPERVTPEAYLITDLGADSMRMLQIVFRMEELGVAVPLDLAWRIQTVGDAYRYYVEQTIGSSDPEDES